MDASESKLIRSMRHSHSQRQPHPNERAVSKRQRKIRCCFRASFRRSAGPSQRKHRQHAIALAASTACCTTACTLALSPHASLAYDPAQTLTRTRIGLTIAAVRLSAAIPSRAHSHPSPTTAADQLHTANSNSSSSSNNSSSKHTPCRNSLQVRQPERLGSRMEFWRGCGRWLCCPLCSPMLMHVSPASSCPLFPPSSSSSPSLGQVAFVACTRRRRRSS
jgi:hypothetical protein